MADLVLPPLTAFGRPLPLIETHGAWTLTERIDVALASLAVRRGRAAEVQTLAATAGIPLPGPGRAETSAIFGAFWMTPDMWMVEAPLARHPDIRKDLVALYRAAASITEQTDGWVRLDLSGPDLPRLFERLTNLDLAPAAPGFASRTVIDHLGCYLIKRSAEAFTLYGPRSSAESLHHAITLATASLA